MSDAVKKMNSLLYTIKMLGVHVAKESHVLDDKTPAALHVAIPRDLNKLGLNCAQIFTHGPRFLVQNKIDVQAVISATQDINLSVHSAYSTTGIWKITNGTSAADKKRIEAVRTQLAACQKIMAHGLVVHITKIYPEDAAAVMHKIRTLAIKYKVKIILEMVASKADPEKTYETPEKLDNLTTLIDKDSNSSAGGVNWWGWCVDTAHLWGAGVDIASYANMSSWLNRITHKRKIVMFHLNGSSAERGSGKDKHEIAFGPDDKIWRGIKPEESGVAALIQFAGARDIPVICEINRGTQANVIKSLTAIKNLYK